ncbi:hypothetical protein AMTR_s00162p00044670 [Amborella trichopoda]|uniref:Uncharacterized protein n=1 Tax=Amborella trichopoda TaxID=13333 RepID=W1PQ58_AMBTC|nr:hypothetical protein AMTR_s00162p00044670 [Amborella trichopoda]
MWSCLAGVFYRLHLTWNPASPNALAFASLPPSSPEEWTTVKRKFKCLPHPFLFATSVADRVVLLLLPPPIGCRSEGRAQFLALDSCPSAPSVTPHAPLAMSSNHLPPVAHNLDILSVHDRARVCAPRVPSPLGDMSRYVVSDLIASVPCPSSPLLIAPSSSIIFVSPRVAFP